MPPETLSGTCYGVEHGKRKFQEALSCWTVD
jgi:hypothetical protein